MIAASLALALLALSAPAAQAGYTLVNGVPSDGYAYRNGHAYFRFPLDWSKNAPVVITVESASGDPSMFVGCTSYPTTAAPWKRQEPGNDTLKLTPADLSSQNCTSYVYIMVQGEYESIPGPTSAVSFVIVAVYDSARFAYVLTDGALLPMRAEQNSVSYASFTVPAGTPTQPLTFSLTPIIGAGAELYVSANAAGKQPVYPVERCLKYSGSTGLCSESEALPGSYTASTASPGADPGAVVFSSVQAGQVYIVALMSSAGDYVLASVGVALGTEELPIGMGQPEFLFVAQYSYSRYFATIAPPSPGDKQPAIVANAYPLSGSAALYLSDQPRPTNTSHRWGAVGGTSDSQVVIPYSQLSQYCPGLTLGFNCTIHIGVQGLASTLNWVQFYISYSNSPDFPETLVMGGTVNLDMEPRTNGYALAKLNIPTGHPSWTISTEVVSGSCEVYIVVGDGKRFYPASPADAHPSSSSGVAIARFEYQGPSDAVALSPASEVIPDVYCSNCEVRVTVAAGSFGCQAAVTLTVDDVNELVPLAEGIPTAGVVGYNSYDYYSFEVDMPASKLSPIQLELRSLGGGDADMFVMVRNASAPNQMPSKSSYTWRAIASGDDLLEISPSDKHFAGTATYIIAVYGARYNQDSEYSVTARVLSAAVVDPLPPDQPATVTISPGAYHFFLFTPCADSSGADGCGPTDLPAVLFRWTVGLGSVSAFVTNQYYRSSPPSLLPTKGNSALSTLWSITNGTTQAFIGPGVPGYDAARKTYAIGILGTSPYSVTVTLTGHFSNTDQMTITQLTLGQAMGPFTVQAATNTYFSVDYTDASANTDMFFSAESLYGNVRVVAAPPQSRTGQQQAWPPRCKKYSLGGVTCLGWVFESDPANFGTADIGIDHMEPCRPYSGTANSNCTTSMLREGTWLVTVYASTASSFSILAQTADSHVTLEEGVTETVSSQLTQVCSNRDPSTGLCPQASAKSVYAAWMEVEIPVASSNGAPLASALGIKIDRQCNLGGCSDPLEIYALSCYPSDAVSIPSGRVRCDNSLAFPSAEMYNIRHEMGKGSSAFNIHSTDLCGMPASWNDDQVPTDNDWGFDDPAVVDADGTEVQLRGHGRRAQTQGSKCVWYFGVFSGRTRTRAGVYEQFDATLSASDDGDVTTIAQDETRPGTTFDGGVEHLSTIAPAKYYSAYFNASAQPQVMVQAYACAGVPTIYACWPSSSCSDNRHPKSGNSQQSGSFSFEHSAAVLTFTSLPAVELDLGVSVAANGATSPSFRLTITTGAGPVLRGPDTVTAAFNQDGQLEISWTDASIARQGQRREQRSSTPTVYVFATLALPAGSQPGSECGVHHAYDAINGAPGVVATASSAVAETLVHNDEQGVPAVTVVGEGSADAQRFALPFGTTQTRVNGLDRSKIYTVSVVSSCGLGCSPVQGDTLVAAGQPITVYPGDVSPSPSPRASGQPLPSATPSSAPPPPPATSASPSPGSATPGGGVDGGAVAGIVIGSLAAVGMAGGVFWWCRRTGGHPGDEMGYYTSAD